MVYLKGLQPRSTTRGSLNVALGIYTSQTPQAREFGAYNNGASVCSARGAPSPLALGRRRKRKKKTKNIGGEKEPFAYQVSRWSERYRPRFSSTTGRSPRRWSPPGARLTEVHMHASGAGGIRRRGGGATTGGASEAIRGTLTSHLTTDLLLSGRQKVLTTTMRYYRKLHP